MLRQSKDQGVFGMIATPHYYPTESIAHFLKRRSHSIERLQKALQEDAADVPELCFGAEVAYHVGLTEDEDLELLCLGKSRYLLLELPFSAWPSYVLRDIWAINARGITPIIAHIERYIGYQTPETAQMLLDANVLIQVNAGALVGWSGRKGRKFLRQGKIDVLASDAHNLVNRPPNLGIVTKKLDGRFHDALEEIRERNGQIFCAAMGERAGVGV